MQKALVHPAECLLVHSLVSHAFSLFITEPEMMEIIAFA